MPQQKKILTQISCNQLDCMYINSDLKICTHNNPDLWLWKTTEEVDWNCYTYQFNPIYGLSENELREYRKTRVFEDILEQRMETTKIKI